MQWALPEQKLLGLKMRITSWMADHLDETPLSDGQSVITDEANPDRFILEAKVLDSLQLRRWILSQGEGLVVEADACIEARFMEDLG